MSDTFVSLVVQNGDPVPRCYMGGGGLIPIIRFDSATSIQLTPDVNPHYLREFAASLLHLAGLAESAHDDLAMERACAAEGRAS
jgi:hypothetical protein